MPEPTRTPRDHYQDAERLLTAAESSVTESMQATAAALCAVGHALLAAAPRRARKRPPEPGRHEHGTSDGWGWPA